MPTNGNMKPGSVCYRPRVAQSSSASILDQVRRHSVALISLAVALAGLGYNTWRNEQTEENRNVRHAGFEVLLKLGELQRLVFDLRYDRKRTAGTPRVGWSYVLEIRDLCGVLPEPMPAVADRLHSAWAAHWNDLESDDPTIARSAERPISRAIDEARARIVEVLNSLD
ncbi:hypothetical protein BH24PSE2_BH24PSE2_24620 [soil metagenome]